MTLPTVRNHAKILKGVALLLASAFLLSACQMTSPPKADAASKWPYSTLQLGFHDNEDGAAVLRRRAPFMLRYHYLAGGVNTNAGWQTWRHGGHTFVADYINDTAANGMLAVFSYYQLRQSLPGAGNQDEQAAVIGNLGNVDTMRAWFEDLRAFYAAAATTGQPAVLQLEPDMWGYVQKHSGDDARRQPAMVAATGLPELKGLPNTVAGLARGALRMRNQIAPQVIVGYPISIWGTNKDIAISNEPPEAVDALAVRSAAFYRSLGTRFDVLFAEFADRDSQYAVERAGANPNEAWWDAEDFARHTQFLGRVHDLLRLPIVLWQIPLGNTINKPIPGLRRHYADNRVQWLLGVGSRAHLTAYLRAGVVALLFGSGQTDGTCACANPAEKPLGPLALLVGNEISVLDDDGGYFHKRANAYYRAGARALPTRLYKHKPVRKKSSRHKASAKTKSQRESKRHAAAKRRSG